jgi:hypothetical protein
MLEAQKFDRHHGDDLGVRVFHHIGYMRAYFAERADAVLYYDMHNPHMRSIDAYGNGCSDWDANTKLRFVIRDYHHDFQTVPTFDPADEPKRVGPGQIEWPELPRPPRRDYTRAPFASWVDSLRQSDGRYVYDRAPEVAEFLDEFDMTNVPDCESWREFTGHLPNFVHFKGDVKQNAVNTFNEWFHGPGGRQMSPNFLNLSRH